MCPAKSDSKFEDDLVLALATEPVVRAWLQQSADAQPIIKPYVTKLTSLIIGLQDQIHKLTKERDSLQAKTEKQEAIIQSLRKKTSQLQDQAATIGNELKRQRSHIAVLQEQTDGASTPGSASTLGDKVTPAGGDDHGPAPKRARLTAATLVRDRQWADPSAPPGLVVPETGFQMPQRRKLTLQILPFDQTGAVALSGGLRAVSGTATGGTSPPSVDFGISWSDIEDVFCLPLPGRAKPSWNFIALPKADIGPDSNGYVPEPILWNVPEPSKKDLEAGKPVQPDHLVETINAELKKLTPPKAIVTPDPDQFFSRVEQPVKKGEKPVWVRAFRGTLEGHLFFLRTGLLFGFRKPLLYIPLDRVISVSYTSVVKRTFTLTVSYTPIKPASSSGPQNEAEAEAGAEQAEEIEFSMIDQDDHPGIDYYVQLFGLNDESMSQKRKAKRLNINPPDGTETGAGGVGVGAGGDRPGGVAVGSVDSMEVDACPTDSDDSDFEVAKDSDGNPLDGTDGEGYTSSEDEDDEDGDGGDSDGGDVSDSGLSDGPESDDGDDENE